MTSSPSTRILRVFPRRTKQTPDDELAVIGSPGLFRPEVDEVHVSVTFTWDLRRARELVGEWSAFYPVVRTGGPALGDPGDRFIPGRYLKLGNVITSRGCPNRCSGCLVPEREGPLRLLPITEGWRIQDNNLTACPRSHVEAVFEMLNRQRRGAEFVGGLKAERLDPWWYEMLRSLKRLRFLFLAYDDTGFADWIPVKFAIKSLQEAGFSRRQIRCYVLIGQDGDRPKWAENRLKKVMDAGALPFPMPFQPPDAFRTYNGEWRPLIHEWSRPAIAMSKLLDGCGKAVCLPA